MAGRGGDLESQGHSNRLRILQLSVPLGALDVEAEALIMLSDGGYSLECRRR